MRRNNCRHPAHSLLHMLVGLVVNNAILLLEFTMQKIREGVTIKDALWMATEDKFKAILMTSIAIV